MIKVWADSVLGEDLSPGLQTTTFLLYPHMVWRERETEMERERETEMERERETEMERERQNALVSLPLLMRALISSWGPHPHDLIEH